MKRARVFQSAAAAIAYALACALVHSDNKKKSACAHLAKTLGREWPWIDGLSLGVRRKFGVYGGSVLQPLLEEVAAYIETRVNRERHSALKIHCYFLVEQVMRNAPLSLPLALPALPTMGDLALWCNVATEELSWFAGAHGLGKNISSGDERLAHYQYRWIPKRNGSLRLLEIPKPRLRSIQRRILHGILDYVPPHEAAHGFRARHSTLSHAAAHVGRVCVVKMDLRDFFISVPVARIHALFHTIGFPQPVARLLAGLCTHAAPARALLVEGCPDRRTRQRYTAAHLPPGAPTSPALANLCAFHLDLRLNALAQEAGATYTRYADDMAFSGDAVFARGVQPFIAQVIHIVSDEGFTVNGSKTRIMRSSMRQQLTGWVVNKKTNVRRDEFDRLKAILHQCKRDGAALQNRDGHNDFRAHLQGRISHVSRNHPARAARLKTMFEAIQW